MDYNLTDEALEKLGNLFVDQLKEKIRARIYAYGNPVRGKGNKIATGELYNSLKSKVIKNPDEPAVLEISYADYFKYVNLGRRAGIKRVPIQALLDWIKVKKLRFRTEKGRFKKGTQLQLAFAVQTNIFKFGIRPSNIYDKALDSIEDLFDNPTPELAAEFENVYEAIAEDINIFIERIIEEPTT